MMKITALLAGAAALGLAGACRRPVARPWHGHESHGNGHDDMARPLRQRRLPAGTRQEAQWLHAARAGPELNRGQR